MADKNAAWQAIDAPKCRQAMTMPTKEQKLILQVVRGERPWNDLQEIGVQVALETTDSGHLKAHVENPTQIEAVAKASDLAQGLLSYYKDPKQFHTWAFVLEAGNFVDFDLDGDPAGEVLLNALWDASFGNPIEARALQVAKDLVVLSNVQAEL